MKEWKIWKKKSVTFYFIELNANVSYYWLTLFPARGLELVTWGFALVTRGCKLVTRGFELLTRKVELVTREFELVDLNS